MALDMNRNHLTALAPLLHFLGDEYMYTVSWENAIIVFCIDKFMMKEDSC